jgi:hypothetical protein
MAKFHGLIGYVQTEETAPGVYTEVATEYPCRGEIIRNTQRWDTSGQLNDNLSISNQFTIIGDTFAYQNFQNMRYLNWNGALWKITSVELRRPRLILTVGGVYNAQ